VRSTTAAAAKKGANRIAAAAGVAVTGETAATVRRRRRSTRSAAGLGTDAGGNHVNGTRCPVDAAAVTHRAAGPPAMSVVGGVVKNGPVDHGRACGSGGDGDKQRDDRIGDLSGEGEECGGGGTG